MNKPENFPAFLLQFKLKYYICGANKKKLNSYVNRKFSTRSNTLKD